MQSAMNSADLVQSRSVHCMVVVGSGWNSLTSNSSQLDAIALPILSHRSIHLGVVDHGSFDLHMVFHFCTRTCKVCCTVHGHAD